MPGKSNKPPKPRKRNAANASANAEVTENHSREDVPVQHIPSPSGGRPISAHAPPTRIPESATTFYPPYRDDVMMNDSGNFSPGQGAVHSASPVQNTTVSTNGMGVSSSSFPFPHSTKGVVENGYGHSSPSLSQTQVQTNERDTFSKVQ